jgi:hypothetical protein
MGAAMKKSSTWPRNASDIAVKDESTEGIARYINQRETDHEIQ